MINLKTKEEIELLKEGGKHLSFLLSELAKLAKPGVKTDVFEDASRKIIKELGDHPGILNYTPAGARRPYPASTCISINDEIVHGIPNEHPRKLKEGDIVSIDGCLIHKGLYVDSAITVPVGSISNDAHMLLKATKEALEAGISKAKAGGFVGDIGEAVSEIAQKYNFNIAEDLCGHGVGYAVHEDPFVPNFGKTGTGEKLIPGMVIAIEPMLILERTKNGQSNIKLDPDGYTYRSKSGAISAHFEHTVVITDGEPIVVTR